MIQLVSLLGAVTILAAYGANQFGRLRATSLVYAVANVVGAGVLSVVAAVESQWGFLLLEGVWCLLAAVAAARILRGPVAA
ncbi:MAG: CBU_0592 family membrane protein [Gaiellaceae bacterium]